MPELVPGKTRILIVGLGLIGGSYADALSHAGFETGAIDSRCEAIDHALARGLIAHGRTVPEQEYLAGFDLVVFALYPHVFVEWVQEYGSLLPQGALVTDVTGVKSSLIPQLNSLLRPDIEFVAAHPMAGKELGGVENSDRRIFRDANFIITPVEGNSDRGIQTVRELAWILGFSKISIISPEEHDEMVGFLSQLTHCIAVALMTCKESSQLADYTGDSFRDLTRIARINENMWTELFMENRDVLVSQIDLFMDRLDQIRQALGEGDTATLKRLMRLSTERRAYFDKER